MIHWLFIRGGSHSWCFRRFYSYIQAQQFYPTDDSPALYVTTLFYQNMHTDTSGIFPNVKTLPALASHSVHLSMIDVYDRWQWVGFHRLAFFVLSFSTPSIGIGRNLSEVMT